MSWRLPATGFLIVPSNVMPVARSKRTLNTGGMPLVECWPSGAGLPGVMSITADLSGFDVRAGIDQAGRRSCPSHFMMTVRSRFCLPVV